MSRPFAGRHGRGSTPPLLVAAAVALAGCGTRTAPDGPAPVRFSTQIQEILTTERTAPEYYEALSRLEAMGPEVDAVLVALARDPAGNTTARSNALVLLADRNSPAALAALRRAILLEEIPRLRSAAVFGLNLLADTSVAAANMLKAAVGDPVRSVRLNALQALDIREVATMRSVIENDRDREVRAVAMQLVAIAESRGAPLQPDRRGALRTTGTEREPAIVFRPATIDSIGGHASGDLRVELPNDQDIPLAQTAEVVAGVVPAFFSPDRSQVVYEADREIRTVDLETREIRVVGPGVAPRPIPFTNEFVFLREKEGSREEAQGGTRIEYEVYRSGFAAEPPQLEGELMAMARPELRGHYSPVRWMVVGEAPDGFWLRGQGLTPFPLPAPAWGTGSEPVSPGGSNNQDANRGWW